MVVRPIFWIQRSMSAHFSILGSPDGDRTPKPKVKAKVPRELPNAPKRSHPRHQQAAESNSRHRCSCRWHRGRTQWRVRLQSLGLEWAYPMPSELPPPPKPLTASAPKPQGQEPTIDKADKTFLEPATTGDSIARNHSWPIRRRQLLMI